VSGWGFHDYAGAVLVAGFILIGLSSLLRRPQSGRSWWSKDRFYGAAMIFVGLEHVGDPGRFMDSPLLNIVIGGAVVALGLWMLLVDPLLQAHRQREQAAELSSLAAHASAYSDSTYDAERRAIEARTPLPVATRERVVGGLLVLLFGGFFITLGLIGARQ
jgi:hypothetical protein